ncbi:hypothetical protein F5Y07DRAFT_366180 [Xylaria sp. FL0933]|nr:hypothetical protein F5Y07DRAFT_366180 [Xylaria sp. FL0933]
MSFATTCITDACTVREALFTKNQTSVQCNEPPYTNKTFVPVIITFFILALIVIFLRAAARIVSQAKFWYDDYFNFAAFVVATVYTLTDVHLASQGLGVDIWAVPQDNITYIFINILTGCVLYATSRTLMRISILLFYLRIFDTTCAKNVIKWTLTFITFFYPAVLFPIIFQCSPVNYLWLRWDGTHNGHCIDFRIFIWVITTTGIALDFWIVLISCRLVIGLQLPLKKKLLVSGMFTAGLLTVAVSIVRLPCTNQFTVTENPTIDWIPITILSALENYIGVICASLPSLPALFRPRSAVKIPGTTKKTGLWGCFKSQEAQVVEHTLRLSGMPHDSLELAPTSGKVNGLHQEDGSIVSGNAHQMYLHFTDSEPGSL